MPGFFDGPYLPTPDEEREAYLETKLRLKAVGAKLRLLAERDDAALAMQAQLREAVSIAAAKHAQDIGRPHRPVRFFKAAYLGIRTMMRAIEAGIIKIFRIESEKRGGALWLEIIS